MAQFVTQCGESPVAAAAASTRLQKLQMEMKKNPTHSLRQLAYAVVTEWERDFEAALGNYGIEPLYEALLKCRQSAK